MSSLIDTAKEKLTSLVGGSLDRMLAALRADADKKRFIKPKYEQIGMDTVAHFYHPTHPREARKLIKKYGAKHVMENLQNWPFMERVQVKQVPVRIMRRIDYSKKYARAS